MSQFVRLVAFSKHPQSEKLSFANVVAVRVLGLFRPLAEHLEAIGIFQVPAKYLWYEYSLSTDWRNKMITTRRKLGYFFHLSRSCMFDFIGISSESLHLIIVTSTQTKRHAHEKKLQNEQTAGEKKE